MIAAAAAAFCQTQSGTPDTVIRITVNLVQVDAVVTDSKGQPVTDLQADDFVILQDGKPQKITNFSYIRAASTSESPGRSPAPAARGGHTPPPAVFRAKDVKRTIAFVVDDLGLSFESIYHVRQSIKKFVDQEMAAGDLVAVIRTGAGMGALQQFTADKRILCAAIERIKYNAVGRVGVSSFRPLGDEPDLGSAEANDARDRANEARAEIFSVGTLGAIRFVVDGLRELNGRKSVILFSENMRLFNNDGSSQRVLDSVRHLTDAANRASAVIYSIDPRGLQYYGLTAADNTKDSDRQSVANLASTRAEEVFRSQDGLVMLAQETGGLFLHNTNDVDGMVRRAVKDSEGYYLIGYHPDGSTFDAKTGDPKFHKVAVRVNRAGLQVRSRSGFYGTSDREARAVPKTRQGQIAHALASPFSSGGIHVRLTPLFTNSPTRGSYLNTMLHIDAADLKFTDEPDGHHKAVIDLVAITFGDNGQAVDSSDRTYTLRADQQTYGAALKQGLLYTVSHPVKRPGPYQMRVVVRDATSERIGSASQFIEVPDVNKDRLTLSSIVLREQAQTAAPPTAEHPEGQIPDPDPQGSAAVRIFRPGGTMIYGYQILNAQTGPQKTPELELQTLLFRDGKQVYGGKPAPLDTTGQSNPKNLVAGGMMKLGPAITPGDYILQVIVRDKQAKGKYATATQWMDFQIQAPATPVP